MQVEMYKDKLPEFIPKNNNNYVNSVIQGHLNIQSGVRDTQPDSTSIELACRLQIASELIKIPNEAIKFINAREKQYYNEELEKLNGNNLQAKIQTAKNLAWIRLESEAYSVFLRRYKVGGTRTKYAVIDDITPDDKKILDPHDAYVKKIFKDLNIDFVDDDEED